MRYPVAGGVQGIVARGKAVLARVPGRVAETGRQELRHPAECGAVLSVHRGGNNENPQHGQRGWEQAGPEQGYRRTGLGIVPRRSEMLRVPAFPSSRSHRSGSRRTACIAERVFWRRCRIESAVAVRQVMSKTSTRVRRRPCWAETPAPRGCHGSRWDVAWRLCGFRRTLIAGAETRPIDSARHGRRPQEVEP